MVIPKTFTDIELSVFNQDQTEDRLDYLKELLNISKSQLKKYLIKDLTKPVQFKEKLVLPLDIVNYLKINPNYLGPSIKILHQDANLLVLSKPFNTHCAPLRYTDQYNCLSFIRQSSMDILEVNKDSYDRGLLNRLDHCTSGVLIYIKNSSVYQDLRENFDQRVFLKQYLALVHGHFDQEGEHQHYLRSSGKKGSKVKVSSNQNQRDPGLLAKLQVKLKSFDPSTNTSLVEIILKTGRRHQIRSQLAHLGHPIVGDKIYGSDQLNSPRIYLHAWKYGIYLKGKQMIFIDDEFSLLKDFLHGNRSF